MQTVSNAHQTFLPVVVGIPIDLYESTEGNFYIGMAEGLRFGAGTAAWAGLFNPLDSGVNLYVWAFGISNVKETAYRIQIWFNAQFPGESRVSEFVSPANTAQKSLRGPKVQLKFASGVSGSPGGGTKAFVRRGQPDTGIYSVEDGKFIFPPGGNLTIWLANPETPGIQASGTVFYQWWEERI